MPGTSLSKKEIRKIKVLHYKIEIIHIGIIFMDKANI